MNIDPNNIQNGDYEKACAVMQTIHWGAEAAIQRDAILNYLKLAKAMKPREVLHTFIASEK